MANGLPWYAHHIQKYQDKTSHLGMLEHGAYRLMLDHYYKYAAPLPAPIIQVHRICRAVAEHEQAVVSAILNEFFVLKGDGWHNLPADEELEAMANVREKRQKAAKIRHGIHNPASADTLNTKQSISSLRSDIEPAKQKRRALSQLPDDVPSQDDRSAAIEFWNLKGRNDLAEAIEDQVQAFRDHHTSKGSRMADWPAAWRTWRGNALKFNRKEHGNGKRTSHESFAAGALAAANELDGGN